MAQFSSIGVSPNKNYQTDSEVYDERYSQEFSNKVENLKKLINKCLASGFTREQFEIALKQSSSPNSRENLIPGQHIKMFRG